MRTKEATERQRQAYEAVGRLGSTIAASNELKIGISSLCNLVKLYSERTGVPYPVGMVKRDGSHRGRPVLGDVVEAIEASVRALLERERVRDATLAELVEMIRELNARQPLLLVERYTSHRRQSDGGAGGKAERGGR